MEHFIQTYGYLALLIGALAEGETILMLAGFAAHRGYLALPLVIIIGAAATTLCDQFLYFMGKFYGQAFLEKRPHLKARTDSFRMRLQEYQNLLIVGFRFMYGMRIVAPFVIGMSGIGIQRFAVLNIFSALLWTSLFGSGGYFFGTALELVIGDIRQYEFTLMGGIVLLGVLAWAFHFYRTGRLKRT